MKKLIFMLTAVIFIFTACQKEEGALDPATATSESGFHKDYPAGEPCITTKMIADGGEYDEYCTGTWVGNIKVWDDGSTITVIYEIIDPGYPGWVIDATQLYVGPEDSIPATKKGNPKIGKFPFKGEYEDPAVTVAQFILTGDDYPMGDYVISAHADVRYDIDDHPPEGFCESLPATATIVVVSGEPVSYMTATITDAGWLDGTYESWCIDEEHGINSGQIYSPAYVYCTTNGDANFLVHVDGRENFDNLNWLLNQDFVGKTSACGGVYSVMDVQYAIWYLMDDYVQNPLPPDPENCRQEELEQLALIDGEGFVPGCGDYVAVAFDPSYFDDETGLLVNAQKVIIAYPLTCDREETAWGYGYWDFVPYCDSGQDGVVADGIAFSDSGFYGGSAWGWYFGSCNWSYVAP